MKEKNINNLGVPIAIVLAGVIVAGAIFFGPGTSSTNNVATGPSSLDNIREVSRDDYIKGNRDAKVKIVEYSDLECPFCKRFHGTVEEVQDRFGEDNVAWVFRHFPLDALHKKARAEANAVTCAGDLGGNDIFWEYLDLVFDTTTSNDGLDLSLLPTMAAEVGLDVDKFNTCLENSSFADAVETDYQNARDAGGSGTPFPVIVVETRKKINLAEIIPAQILHSVSSDGKSAALRGAIPFDTLEPIIEEILNSI